MDQQIAEQFSTAHALAQATFRPAGRPNNAYEDRIWAYLLSVYRGAKKNAARKGRSFTIGVTDLRALYDASGGLCVISGRPFDLDRYGGSRAPFAPSIDRIDCACGYEPGNVRLVCQIVNLAMNTWGECPVRQLLATTP